VIARECVCGEPATVDVQVEWVNGTRRYRYCEECAADITEFIEGTVVVLP